MKENKVEQFMKILDKLDIPSALKNSIKSKLEIAEDDELEDIINSLPIAQTSSERKRAEASLDKFCRDVKEKNEEQDADKILENI